MTTLKRQDDRLHLPGSAANWRESYFFGFHDEAGRAGVTYISLSPNQGVIVRMVILLLPESVATLVHVQQAPLAIFEDGILNEGGLRYYCLEPLQRWQLQADVDCWCLPSGQELSSALAAARTGGAPVERISLAFDLTYEASMSAFRFPVGTLDFLGEGQQHFEQMGRVSGWLRIGAEEIPLIALCVRDHSWGMRDWLRFEWYSWLNLSFEDLFISAILSRAEGREESSGFVCQGGLIRPIVRVVVEAQRDADDLHLLTGQAQVMTEGGQTFDLEFAPLSFFHMLLAQEGPWQNHDSLTLVTSRCGERTGRGFLDYERREQVPPIAPDHAGMF